MTIMPKVIWMFWLQGWEEATELSKACIQSWVDLNPDWTVIALSKDNIGDYLDLDEITDDFFSKEPISCTVDIININLLKKYGGIWIDSTVLCLKPLDDWLGEYLDSGIFVHKFDPLPPSEADNCNKVRLLSTWFIAAEKDNYIISEWCRKYNDYWKGRKEPSFYFDFHYLFFELYNIDDKFKSLFDEIPLRNAHDAHQLNNFVGEALSDELSERVLKGEFYLSKYQNVYLDNTYSGQEQVKKLLSAKHANHLSQNNNITGLLDLKRLVTEHYVGNKTKHHLGLINWILMGFKR